MVVGVRKTKEEFIKELEEIHGKVYDTSKVVYENYKTDVILSCSLHGEFLSSPKRLIAKRRGCPTCYKTRFLERDLVLLERIKSEGYIVNCDHIDYKTNGFVTTDVIYVTCSHKTRKVSIRKIREGHFRCGICLNTLSWDTWSTRFKRCHGDRYLYETPIGKLGANIKINIFCKVHGWFKQAMHKHLYQNCPECSVMNLKPHNVTIAKRNKEEYKKKFCVIYIIHLEDDIHKVGISTNYTSRMEVFKRDSRYKNITLLDSFETNLYDAILCEDKLWKDLNLITPLYTKKFGGYTETFIDKHGAVEQVRASITDLLNL